MHTAANRGVASLLCLAAVGCTSSVTRIASRVDHNPLEQVASRAVERYSVEWVDANTLKLRDTWWVFSILTTPMMGFNKSGFSAELHYSEPQLHSTFWFEIRSFILIFFPAWTSRSHITSSDADFVTRLSRSRMYEILDWAGVAPFDRQETCGPP